MKMLICKLQVESNSIIESTSKFYDSRLCPEGKQFKQSTAEELFKDVIARIEKIKDKKFKITDDYKGELLHFIVNKAVTNFSAIHKKYCREAPKTLLEQKRAAYRQIFFVQMGKGDGALTFCNVVLKKIIDLNVFQKMTCSDLLDVLRKHSIFKDVRHFQTKMMENMLIEDQFDRYLQYITDYEQCVKQAMTKESTRFFEENERLKNLAKSKLKYVLVVLHRVVNKTVQDSGDSKSFISQLYNQMKVMKTLKIPHNEFKVFLEIDNIPVTDDFAEIIHEQLQETLQKNITKMIDSLDVSEFLKKIGLTEFVFKEVLSCAAQCPFCKVPCDTHSGGKTDGPHSATQHRPQGLGGFRDERSDKLLLTYCPTNVLSSASFRHRNNKVRYRRIF